MSGREVDRHFAPAEDGAVVAAPHYAAFDPDAPRGGHVNVIVRAADTVGLRDTDAEARLAVGVYGGEPGAWRHRLTRTLQRPGSLFAIAEVDGQVAGYGKAARCTPVDDTDPAPPGRYLTGLIVARTGGVVGLARR